jgi:hypothetical protein
VTFTEPVAGNVPRPLMLTEFALLAVQLSTVDAPVVTVPGRALSITAGAWLVELFCVAIDPPPHALVAVKTVSKKTNADMRRKNRIDTPLR